MALFLQGCSGDVNPIGYKEVDRPKNALLLGEILGHSVLTALQVLLTLSLALALALSLSLSVSLSLSCVCACEYACRAFS